MTFSDKEHQLQAIRETIGSGAIHPDNPFLIEINKKYRELCNQV